MSRISNSASVAMSIKARSAIFNEPNLLFLNGLVGTTVGVNPYIVRQSFCRIHYQPILQVSPHSTRNIREI